MFPQAPAPGQMPANPFPTPAPTVHPSAQQPAAQQQLPQQQQQQFYQQPQMPPQQQYMPAPQPAPVPSAGGFTPGPAPAFGQAPVPGVFTPPPPGTPITAAPPAPPPAPPVDTTGQQLAQVQAELQAAQQQLMASRQYVQLGQHAAAQRMQQQPQQQQPGQQQQGPQVNALGVVKFDPSELQFITTDQAGNFVATPGAPFGTLDRFMQNRAQTAQALRRIAEDPEGALGAIIEKRARDIAGSEVQKQIQEDRRQGEIRSVLNEISPWAFARDAAGQELQQFNYVTQSYEPVLTQQGHAYNQALMLAENYGVQSARQRHDLAMRILQAQRPAPAAAPQQQVPTYGNRTFGSPQGMQSQGVPAYQPASGYQQPQTIAGIYQQQYQPTGVPTRVPQPMPQQQIGTYPAPPAGSAPAARATLAQMMMQDLAAVRAGQSIAA